MPGPTTVFGGGVVPSGVGAIDITGESGVAIGVGAGGCRQVYGTSGEVVVPDPTAAEAEVEEPLGPIGNGRADVKLPAGL
jgi:hypothetical protein